MFTNAKPAAVALIPSWHQAPSQALRNLSAAGFQRPVNRSTPGRQSTQEISEVDTRFLSALMRLYPMCTYHRVRAHAHTHIHTHTMGRIVDFEHLVSRNVRITGKQNSSVVASCHTRRCNPLLVTTCDRGRGGRIASTCRTACLPSPRLALHRMFTSGQIKSRRFDLTSPGQIKWRSV